MRGVTGVKTVCGLMLNTLWVTLLRSCGVDAHPQSDLTNLAKSRGFYVKIWHIPYVIITDMLYFKAD